MKNGVFSGENTLEMTINPQWHDHCFTGNRMKVAEKTESHRLNVSQENTIKMPMGLLGFEQFKEFVLLANPEDEPFLWLQVIEEPSLAFLVMSPFMVVPNYQPDIPDEDAGYLGLQGPEDACVLNIVTVSDATRATMNLKGPIVLNRRTLMAKQVIPANAAEYSVQHPLPVETN